MKRYILWLRITIVLQVLSAAAHSLSFIAEAEPRNETEKQFFDLMRNYHWDMGEGFTPTMDQMTDALSACFPLLYLLGALQNWFLLRKKVAMDVLKGMTAISVVIFGASFVIMYKLTFLPPIICSGLVFVSLPISYFTIPKERS